MCEFHILAHTESHWQIFLADLSALHDDFNGFQNVLDPISSISSVQNVSWQQLSFSVVRKVD
jgi:hypothetical protein